MMIPLKQDRGPIRVLVVCALTTVLAVAAPIGLAQAQWTTNGSNTYTNPLVNNVGIGTSNPDGILHLSRVGNSRILFSNNVDSGSDNTGITIQLDHLNKNSRWSVGVNPGGSTNDLNFGISRSTFNPFSYRPDLAIVESTGNVGIGTASPTEKLHVVGNVMVTGNIAAKYQDVAEWVPSPRALEPGTVVVLDETQTNQVVPSSRGYDTKVAGVVSAQPGLLLGESGDGKVKVATTGRLKVKADARHRPIHAGDLLVTGEQPGTAMASEPIEVSGRRFHQPGTILGKALEALAQGDGEILVLLTLQ